MTHYHLAILKKPYLEAILTGCKTIESRFTRTRRAPFEAISAGDRIFLKVSSGPVCAGATVAAAKNFKHLTPKRIFELKQQYNQYIKGSDSYWESIADCKFGVLIWLADIKPIESMRINKKEWRAWVVLTKDENYGLLESGKM